MQMMRHIGKITLLRIAIDNFNLGTDAFTSVVVVMFKSQTVILDGLSLDPIGNMTDFLHDITIGLNATQVMFLGRRRKHAYEQPHGSREQGTRGKKLTGTKWLIALRGDGSVNGEDLVPTRDHWGNEHVDCATDGSSVLDVVAGELK